MNLDTAVALCKAHQSYLAAVKSKEGRWAMTRVLVGKFVGPLDDEQIRVACSGFMPVYKRLLPEQRQNDVLATYRFAQISPTPEQQKAWVGLSWKDVKRQVAKSTRWLTEHERWKELYGPKIDAEEYEMAVKSAIIGAASQVDPFS
jgi:hypothetical protein